MHSIPVVPQWLFFLRREDACGISCKMPTKALVIVIGMNMNSLTEVAQLCPPKVKLKHCFRAMNRARFKCDPITAFTIIAGCDNWPRTRTFKLEILWFKIYWGQQPSAWLHIRGAIESAAEKAGLRNRVGGNHSQSRQECFWNLLSDSSRIFCRRSSDRSRAHKLHLR